MIMERCFQRIAILFLSLRLGTVAGPRSDHAFQAASAEGFPPNHRLHVLRKIGGDLEIIHKVYLAGRLGQGTVWPEMSACSPGQGETGMVLPRVPEAVLSVERAFLERRMTTLGRVMSVSDLPSAPARAQGEVCPVRPSFSAGPPLIPCRGGGRLWRSPCFAWGGEKRKVYLLKIKYRQAGRSSR